MLTSMKRHFPDSGMKWKKYAKVFIPIVLGSFLFALNGVVDNFMVGHINQGQSALGAINSWTSILMGWFMGTAAAGSVLAGQFFFAKEYDTAKEVARYRFYLSMIPAIILAVIAWTNPDILTKVFVHKINMSDYRSAADYQEGLAAYNLTMQNARDYAHVIAVQWLLISITFNLGNQLREIGLGFYTMLWGLGTLMANITLNSVLMYGVGMGVEGAAWASVAGRIVAFTSGIAVMIFKKVEIGFKPWTIFNVSKRTRILYWKRWFYSMSIFTVTFFIIYRTSIYSLGYPPGSLGVGVSGLSVVSLTGALMNIFTVTFSSLSSMSSRFVGSELGKGNINQARINADQLKGFATLASAFMAIILVIFASLVPYMNFLAESKVGFDGHAQLTQVSRSLYIIAFFYPIWIWFSTSYRVGNSGGKGSLFALVDWVVSGLELIWLFIIVKVLVVDWTFAQTHFWVTYLLFFTADLYKLLFQEILYYKYNWLNVLTKRKVKIQEFKSKDTSELTDVNRRG